MTQRGLGKRFEPFMIGFGLILAALFFMWADGDKLFIFMGFLGALSALLGLLRLVFRHKPS